MSNLTKLEIALAQRDALAKALWDIDRHLDNFGYLPNMKARKLAREALRAVGSETERGK